MSSTQQQLILRAEWEVDGARTVTNTIQVGSSSVVVQSKHTRPESEHVQLSLSFPGLMPALELQGRVTGSRPASGPGKPAGIEIELEAPAEAIARLAQIATSAPEANSAPGDRQFRVLLVEDSAMVRETVLFGAQKHFRTRPDTLKIQEAEDAEKAREKLETGIFDLVLVDHYLPGMNGAELTRWIRANEKTARVPVVAISVGGDETRREFLDAGADLYLDKPIIIGDLFWTLDRLTSLAPRDRGGGARVLMVDDSDFYRAVAQEALEQAGFAVVSASSIDEIEERTALEPDLILMDVQMPEAFGDDVAMVMRHVRGVSIPIYLVSSLDEDDLAARAAEANIDGYIPKKLGVEHLVERVRSILGGQA